MPHGEEMRSGNLEKFLLTATAVLATGFCILPYAAADDVHECNGVFTTQPCDQVPKDIKPGVSTVPGRDLTLAPVQADRPAPRQQAPAQQQQQPGDGLNVGDEDDVEADEGYGDDALARRRAYEAGRAVQERKEAEETPHEGGLGGERSFGGGGRGGRR